MRTPAVPVLRFGVGGLPSPAEDQLAEEEPLRIRVGGRDLGVLLRTPGDDAALAVGFAVGEGLLAGPDHLEDVRVCHAPQRDELLNVAELDLDPGAPGHTREPASVRLVASGCGLCGRTTIETLLAGRPLPPLAGPFDPAVIARMETALAATQDGFRRSGALHAAALFDPDGTLRFAAEDVGRHNAVDKVVGKAFLAGSWPPPPLLMVTSRGSFEIVQKAVAAGLALAAFISAPSTLAVALAEAAGLCLVGFVRPGRFTVYAGRDALRAPGVS